jgi:hypothetical protein
MDGWIYVHIVLPFGLQYYCVCCVYCTCTRLDQSIRISFGHLQESTRFYGLNIIYCTVHIEDGHVRVENSPSLLLSHRIAHLVIIIYLLAVSNIHYLLRGHTHTSSSVDEDEPQFKTVLPTMDSDTSKTFFDSSGGH